jgi:predicted Zn-dependent peptidase
MYPDHPYGRIYPTAEMVNGFTIQQVRDWHRNQWSAQRANITVSGRFDERAVEAAIRSAFGGWQRGNPPVLNVPTPVSRRQLQTVDRPGAPQSTLLIGLPTANPSSPDWIPLVVTNTMLGGYFSSRITANLREDKGYTYSPFSQLSTRYRNTYWAENADVTTANTGASIHEIFYEVNRIRDTPPTAEELAGVQRYLAGNFVLANSSRFGVANQLNYVRLHGLGREYLTNYVRNVMNVTPQDVQRAAQQYIDPSRMLLVVTGDLNVIREQLQPYGQAVP